MEIASLILGIVSLILSLIPFLGIICYLPAIIGIVLGIVALATMKSRGKTKKGKPIAGIIMSGISMVLSIIMIFVWSVIGVGLFTNSTIKNNIFNTTYNSIYNSTYNSIYNSTYDDDYNYDDELSNMTEYEIGDEIKSDYCTVVIDKIEKFAGSTNLKADSGKELIMVTVTVTNTNTDDTETYVSKYDFEINDGNEYDFPEYDSTHKDATFESKYLDVGESMTGTLCFQKEKNNNNYYIVYDGGAKVKVK